MTKAEAILIGLGIMGSGWLSHLLEVGHEVIFGLIPPG